MLDEMSIIKYGLSSINNIDLTKSFEIYDIHTNNHIINLFLIKDDKTYCPSCNSNNIKISGSASSKIKHSSGLENNIVLILNKRRFKCLNCGINFREHFNISQETKTISVVKDLKILESLKDINKTFTSIAKDYDVSPTYVMNLLDKKVDFFRFKLPKVLCIDEVYSDRLVKYKYCCVLYDPHKNNIVDLLSCRHLNFLIDYFSHIPKDEKDAVEFISMDMWESYRTMAKKCLPKAKIAVDSFHVVQQLNNAFNKIRIRVMKKYEDTKKQHGSYYWLYKKHWKLLLMDVGNSSYIKVNDKKTGMELSNLQIIDYMLELDDELRAAYDLKEAYREFNKLRNLDTAEYDLNQFVVKFKSFGKQAYLQFGKLLENWFREIINSFHVVDGRRVSNGKMERVNRDIKTIFRSSYGSKNFIRTRNRVMYCINNDAYILNIRKDKTNSKPQLKPRGKYKK